MGRSPTGRFDLILNRHESYHPGEIARVLAPGGTFLTQQVGGDELGELRELWAIRCRRLRFSSTCMGRR